MNYQSGDEMQKASVKVITGEIKASGKMPVSVNTFFKNGYGIAQK
jgi:hypothetical protein